MYALTVLTLRFVDFNKKNEILLEESYSKQENTVGGLTEQRFHLQGVAWDDIMHFDTCWLYPMMT